MIDKFKIGNHGTIYMEKNSSCLRFYTYNIVIFGRLIDKLEVTND
ncbi:MAG: hypothetical protein QG657_4052 [Acidobacteriota bacterium]|nr:hypothetical protein [Acidobacteriota bacterium]